MKLSDDFRGQIKRRPTLVYQVQCLAVSTNFLLVAVAHNAVSEHYGSYALGIDIDPFDTIRRNGTLNHRILTKLPEPFRRLPRIEFLMSTLFRDALKHPRDIHWY